MSYRESSAWVMCGCKSSWTEFQVVCLSAEYKMIAQTLFSLSRVSFLSSLSNFLKQWRVRWATALDICFSYDFYINSVLYNLVYELNERLRNQLTSLHLWGCTLMALPYVLQVCVYIHPVQTRGAFQLPNVNGQNLINRIELMLEMLLFARFLTTFQVAALI